MKNNCYFTNLIKNKPSNAIKRYFSEVKKLSDKSTKSNIFLIVSPWKLCTGVSVGLAARLLLENGVAYCKAAENSRIIQRRPNITDDSSKFDWNRFLQYLKPHRWLLVAAVAVSSLSLLFS